uniref:Uncharacterized protein n=1 Tax=Rhizophora mucronata TaxID=61149 RepID=A0A2P2N7H8_RHIMU
MRWDILFFFFSPMCNISGKASFSGSNHTCIMQIISAPLGQTQDHLFAKDLN